MSYFTNILLAGFIGGAACTAKHLYQKYLIKHSPEDKKSHK